MRKPGRKPKPPSTLTAEQGNQSSGWPVISQIMKAMVASGVVLFLCNLGLDATKATIFRGWQLEEENKLLKTRLEMIEHNILPKVEQAQKDVREIQTPLDLHDKLTPAQMDKLAFKARGVHAALEEIGYFVRLNTHAALDFPQENDYASLAGIFKLNSVAHTANRQNSIHFANLPEAFPPVVHSKADSLKESSDSIVSLTTVDFVHKGRPNETTLDRATTNILDAPENNRFNNSAASLAGLKEPTVARNLEFEGLPPMPTHRHPDEIRAVVAGHKAALQDCYKQALKIDPSLEGEIKMRFTISTAGQVTAATMLSSTANNPQLERLVLEKIQRWSDFGEVSSEVGDQTFRQTFIFVDAAQADEIALTSRNLTSSILTR